MRFLFSADFVVSASAAALFLLLPLASEADLEKLNLGIYGGQVTDVAAVDDGSGGTVVLIAVDSSFRGVFSWDEVNETWSSVTDPDDSGGDRRDPGCGDRRRGEPRFAIGRVRGSGDRDDVNSGLYVSDNYGDAPSAAVSFVAADRDTGGQLDSVEALVGHSSGIYAGTAAGEVWLNAGAASNPFTKIFTAPTGMRVLSLAVVDASLGYVLTEDGAGGMEFYATNWAGSTTDLTLALPAAAPIELRSSCPSSLSNCDLDVRVVGVDPMDASGQIVYIAGSSTNGMGFKSTDGGVSWNLGWDYQCGLASSGCEDYGFTDGYPQVIRFKGTATSGTESRFVFISRVVRDNDAVAPTWDAMPNLLSTIYPSGITGPSIDISTSANDGALAFDPNDADRLFVATDLAIGEGTHTTAGGFADPLGFEMGNADGIEGLVISDIDFYENSSTNKDLWIATKSGLAKGLNYDPTDPASTEEAFGWVHPIYADGDGAPYTAVAINPANRDEVLAGNGKVYRNTNSNNLPGAATDWVRVFNPFDFSGVGQALESDRYDRTKTTDIEYQLEDGCARVYMTAANEDTGTEGGVFYSDDGGVTWAEDTLDPSTLLKMPVNTAWGSLYNVWVGVGDAKGLGRSAETGLLERLSLCDTSSFEAPSCGTLLATQLESEVVVAMDGVGIGGDLTVYIASQESVYKATLASGSTTTDFCSFSLLDVTPAGESDFNSVAVNSSDADNVWVSFGNCIQESADGGVTWSDYSDACQPEHEAVNALHYDDLLSGTDQGIFAFVPEAPAALGGVTVLLSLLGLSRRRSGRG